MLWGFCEIMPTRISIYVQTLFFFCFFPVFSLLGGVCARASPDPVS